MAGQQPIQISGLSEFVRSLKKMDQNAGKALRLAMNKSMQIIVDDARPKVPKRTGKAAGSIRASSTQGKARISEGGNRVRYMPWLDFGGQRRGRGGGIAKRRFLKQGRYIWASLGTKHDEVIKTLDDGLKAVAQQAGLQVTTNA